MVREEIAMPKGDLQRKRVMGDFDADVTMDRDCRGDEKMDKFTKEETERR